MFRFRLHTVPPAGRGFAVPDAPLRGDLFLELGIWAPSQCFAAPMPTLTPPPKDRSNGTRAAVALRRNFPFAESGRQRVERARCPSTRLFKQRLCHQFRMTVVNGDMTLTSVVLAALGTRCIQPIEGEIVDHREDVSQAADRLLFADFCDLWSRGSAHSGRRSDTPQWEPEFCVLPDGAVAARNVETVDGGLW